LDKKQTNKSNNCLQTKLLDRNIFFSIFVPHPYYPSTISQQKNQIFHQPKNWEKYILCPVFTPPCQQKTEKPASIFTENNI